MRKSKLSEHRPWNKTVRSRKRTVFGLSKQTRPLHRLPFFPSLVAGTSLHPARVLLRFENESAIVSFNQRCRDRLSIQAGRTAWSGGIYHARSRYE